MSGESSESDEAGWVLISLDDRMARRQGLPARLPMPKGALGALAGASVNLEEARRWTEAFLTSADVGSSPPWREQNAELVASLELFLDKAPLWDEARQAFSDDDYDKARSALKRIVLMDPDDHAAKLNLAAAQANLGEHAGALKSFHAIKKTFEGDADYHVAVGQLLMALEQREAAVEQLMLALEAAPDCQPALDALVKLGVLRAIEGSPGEAASLTYVRADKLIAYVTGQWDAEPRQIAFFLEQLAYHAAERNDDVALAAAERAIRLAPGPEERAERGRVAALRALGRLGEATARAKDYLTAAPASAGARVELARCYLAAGAADLVESALGLLVEALDLDSNKGEVRAAIFAMDSDTSLPAAARERARNVLRALGSG
jgi:tetratricopeptide (TPR) repeat protein